MQKMRTIETERTILRDFRLSDIDDVQSFLGSEQVMRFSLNGPYGLAKCEEFIRGCIEQYETKGYGLMAVTIRSHDTAIGYCGICDQQIDGVKEVEIGYRLHPDFWNRGIGSEVAKAVRDRAFEEFGFDRLISIIEPENLSSVRVAEKNGMIHEKDAMFKDAIPVRIYSVTKEKHIQSFHTTPASAPR